MVKWFLRQLAPGPPRTYGAPRQDPAAGETHVASMVCARSPDANHFSEDSSKMSTGRVEILGCCSVGYHRHFGQSLTPRVPPKTC